MKWWLLVSLLILGACDPPMRPAAGDAGTVPPDGADLPSGNEGWARICAKGYGDVVSAKFCADRVPPTLGSLGDLNRLFELSPWTGRVMTGHSTGLGLRSVTPLNPRSFLIGNLHDSSFMVLAFARGEPLVELVANDPVAQTLRFFLVRFHPACEMTTAGCNFADLFTPTIESDWTSYTLEDEEALAGTTVDCLPCHQPNGPGTRKILRMQELLGRWTHWFSEFGESNFNQMHGTENYAGYPGNLLGSPGLLQSLLERNGFGEQPNAFVSQKISNELAATGTSATWQGLYDNAVEGRHIPPPYYGEDQTDPDKRSIMISAYQQVMAGTLARDQLPDIRDILLDSALPAMSIRPKEGLDGRGILIHMCSQCHNSRLDQTLSRARFNVMELDKMSRAEKDQAIARLQLADDAPGKMPPPRFRWLSADEQALAIDELRK